MGRRRLRRQPQGLTDDRLHDQHVFVMYVVACLGHWFGLGKPPDNAQCRVGLLPQPRPPAPVPCSALPVFSAASNGTVVRRRPGQTVRFLWAEHSPVSATRDGALHLRRPLPCLTAFPLRSFSLRTHCPLTPSPDRPQAPNAPPRPSLDGWPTVVRWLRGFWCGAQRFPLRPASGPCCLAIAP